MPNVKSAEKRVGTSRKARERNRAKRSRLRNAIKRVRQAEDAAAAQEHLQEVARLLDRAATKNLIPANRAARLKSQLARHVNALNA